MTPRARERLAELSREAQAVAQFGPAVRAEAERNRIADLHPKTRLAVEAAPADPVEALGGLYRGCSVEIDGQGRVTVTRDLDGPPLPRPLPLDGEFSFEVIAYDD